jgi:hypothetical protein
MPRFLGPYKSANQYQLLLLLLKLLLFLTLMSLLLECAFLGAQ